jgi:hypothetical protein
MRLLSNVICVIARDVQEYLPDTIGMIEKLGKLIKDYTVIVYENDSKDATLDMLKRWRTLNDRVHIISETLNYEKFPQIKSLDRTNRLAYCRNKYLSLVKEKYSSYDVMTVADADMLGWCYRGVANTFSYGLDSWDMIGSYGVWFRNNIIPVHFDSWAYREMGRTVRHEDKYVNDMKFYRGAPLIRLQSCFGGLGFYNVKSMLPTINYHGYDCEHVCLHQEMIKHGKDKIFLNPSQITIYLKH